MEYFSCLEFHHPESWWYHGDTFGTREEAEAFLEKWIPWDDDRSKRIFIHSRPFPPFEDWDTLHAYYTTNLLTFYRPGGGEPVINFLDD